MSDHTKGRLVVDGALLRAENDYVVVNKSSRPRLWEGDLRRLAACWNAFLDPVHTTEMIEKLCEHRVLGPQGISALANKNMALEKELTAARALLREVLAEGNLDMGDQVSSELHNRIESYLDTCDTMGDGDD